MKLHANAQTCPHCRALIVSRVMDGRRAAAVAQEFRVTTKTVLKWITRFRAEGPSGLEDRTSRPHHIARRHLQPGKELSDAVFALLHTPPRDSGFNRTTWRLIDLHSALQTRGVMTTLNNLSAVIKRAGYQWKKARISLTSSDPLYREKVEAIKKVLSGLKNDEAFFSIDEFGPFAVKMRGGKALQPPGMLRQIPQWQKSKGSLIVTAALELSGNQTIHFYSYQKNSRETCKLIDRLRRQYKSYRRIYLSWDAASWHSSKELLDHIDFLNGWAAHDGAPHIEVLPLPAQAQFLNVIESVFSGMARAVIHNSDYATTAAAKVAITRYFEERNRLFAAAPGARAVRFGDRSERPLCSKWPTTARIFDIASWHLPKLDVDQLRSSSDAYCMRAFSSVKMARAVATRTFGPTTTLPWPRISATGLSPSAAARDWPSLPSRHQHVGGAAGVADFPDRNADVQERGVVNHRPQRRRRDAERDHAGGMRVDHAVDVRPRLVGLAVDEALDEQRTAAAVHRIGVEIELHDVLGGHQTGRDRARHQIAARIGGMADADMAIGVEHAAVVENAVGQHQLFDHG
jgi:transposase